MNFEKMANLTKKGYYSNISKFILFYVHSSYAAILVRPEHRSEIDEKYKKRIEGIIRKPQKIEESPILTPCPYCETPVAESELQCDSCRNILPYCIVTGYHIIGMHTRLLLLALY